jgi:hypothetical protein
MGANFFSVLLACGLWFGLEDNHVWGGFLGGGLLFFIGIGITAYFLKQKMEEEPGKWTWGSMWWEIAFGNILRLKAKIEPEIGYCTCSCCVLYCVARLGRNILFLTFASPFDNLICQCPFCGVCLSSSLFLMS